MKILRIVNTGYVAGGAENGIVKINPYLLNNGYNIYILSSDLGPDKQHFNDYSFRNISSAGLLKPLFFLFNPFSFLALKKILREYKPDIIHLHTMNDVTPSVLFLLKRYPVVMTLHGPETFLSQLLIWYLSPKHFTHGIYEKKDLNLLGKLNYFYYNNLQKYLYRLGLKNVDIFIAASKYIQEHAKTDVSPIIHLPNFIELREFHELKNNYNLLFVGRLEKVKGVESMIEALPSIIKIFPQATMTVVGDGSNKEDLIDLTKRLNLQKHIQFTGWVENKSLDKYYEKASIVVVPSTWPEAFGGVILEAMSTGRPVIGTAVGGIPEIIDNGVNGYLVEPKNAEQIAEKVIKLFRDEDLLTEFGKNARKKAETFSIENYVEKLGEIYEETIKKCKTTKRSRLN